MILTRYATFTSDNGRSVTFADAPPFFLAAPPKCAVGSSAQVIKPPGGDGQDTYNVTLDAGHIFLTGKIVAYGDRVAMLERQLEELTEEMVISYE